MVTPGRLPGDQPGGPGSRPRLRLFPGHLLGFALCLGLGLAAAVAVPAAAAGAAALVAALAAVAAPARARWLLLAAALLLGGLGWGESRLATLGHSVLAAQIGTAGQATLLVLEPPRTSPFGARAQVEVRDYRGERVRERALARLPAGEPPAQGAVLAAVVRVQAPRPAADGFDERTWLRRRGVQVVVRVDRWSTVGRRGGIGGAADRLRHALAAGQAGAGEGTRGALVTGVVLGDDQGVPQGLRDRFRASGLYHVLAVSGQNIAFVAAGMLFLAWLLGVPRWLGEIAALAAIGGYVLAVGASPSVVRAGIAGALGSLAWLAGRPRDRIHCLLVGAAVLLAWNPYALLDPGFQLSFSAVAAIFWLAPPASRRLVAAGVPKLLAEPVAISTACGVATAPVLWLQFHAVPLLSVPANALAGPAVAPLLGCALLAALLHPVLPAAATALAWLAGWCGAWIALVARAVGALPLVQARSASGALAAAVVTGLAGAYAWRRWRTN